jgi:cell wall assembly regulator SMI1
MRHSPVVDEEWNKAERHYRMKDANGNHVDISLNPEVPRDVTLIRINVRDFDEAYELLSKRGFKSMLSDKAFNSHNAKIATMASESGLMISLIQHMK